MIKITNPIKTTLRSPLRLNGEAFAEAIGANYGLISSNIAGEDLLHMVTSPPEIYLAEAGGGSVLNQLNMTQSRQENIEIINNLINRIMVSADARLTYQDRVYISSVLKKLGIKDDRRFMEEVASYYSDHKTINKLIELYEDHGSQLKSIIRDYRTDTVREETSKEEAARAAGDLHLHQDIFKRLNTQEFGLILQNFTQNTLNTGYISNTELALSDHTQLARNLYLNELRSVARSEEVPLVYRQHNFYQDTALQVNEEGDTNLQQSLTSAVLLNMVERAYLSRSGDIRNQSYVNYDMRNSLYHSVDNLLNSFRTNVEAFLEGSSYIRQEEHRDDRAYSTETFHIRNTTEGSLEDQMADGYRIEEREIQTQAPASIQTQTPVGDRPAAPNYIRQDYFADQRSSRSELLLLNRLIESLTTGPDVYRINQQDIHMAQAPIGGETPETAPVIRQGDSYISHQEAGADSFYNTDIYLPRAGEETSQEEASLEDIRRINEQNIINSQRHIEQLQSVTETLLKRPERVENAADLNRRRALMALTDPEALELSFREEGRDLMDRQALVEEKIFESLPETSREIFKRVEAYLEAGDIGRLGGSTYDNIGRLGAQISYLTRPVHEDQVHELRESIITETASRIVDRLGDVDVSPVTMVSRQTSLTQSRLVDLVHRQVETSVDQELIEELREQRRLLAEKQVNREETVNNTHTTHTRVINNNIQRTEENNTNIEELIRNSVRSQLGSITDRVYSRLERRLSNERSRRGI